jgi:excinuclease UvrABC ATPase subunit
VVGERGHKLSGGEKQRVAIAHRLSTVVDAHEILVMDTDPLNAFFMNFSVSPVGLGMRDVSLLRSLVTAT